LVYENLYRDFAFLCQKFLFSQLQHGVHIEFCGQYYHHLEDLGKDGKINVDYKRYGGFTCLKAESSCRLSDEPSGSMKGRNLLTT
jgi:hypothetical protein